MDLKTQESRENYNRIAGIYDDTSDGRFTRNFKSILTDTVKLEKGYRVLDVACGNGALLWQLSGKEKIEGYGVDISENMIEVARKKYPGFEFAVANSDNLPFENCTFDVITVSAAFHHFTKPEAFIREAKRVLKDGGTLYMTEVYFPPVVRQLANLVIPGMKMGDVKVYSKRELVKFARDAGYREAAVTRVENMYLFVGRI